jgi:homoserine O-acetyltransferase
MTANPRIVPVRGRRGMEAVVRVRTLVIAGCLAASLAGSSEQRPPLTSPAAPEFSQPAPAVSIVRLETTKGRIDLEVTRAWAPRGADRFVNLVRAGFYDDQRIFRIAPRWTQFGVHGTPAIAQAWRHATIPDDPFIPGHSNVAGTVAFAFAVPNGRTTQVFFNRVDNSATHDDEPFVPFGRVVSGMDVVSAFNDEHGEGPGGIRAGKQDPFFAGGNSWLDRQFPRLDRIIRATVSRK